ncbi:MAG: 4Fe-4S dicluster domain-containing protein [Acidobacteria bacterium]|nr:4Fe-4S dicluster domain-containing protein [Acidobacteriota bacterium]
MEGFEILTDKPQQFDLDKCVHCGLCLNSCPTYRELGLEMDSPRGRVYQMNMVAAGAPVTDSYVEHLELCLACRGCESACPSGVQYGRLIEDARAELEVKRPRPAHIRWLRRFVFDTLLPSRTLLKLAALNLAVYQKSGLQQLMRSTGFLKTLGLDKLDALSPEAQFPTFFSQYGKVFPARGERRYKVVLLGGCIANVSFARLNEATVRVLQANGCEVHVPDDQTCCGALALHAGVRSTARRLATKNVEALAGAGFDAIITNAAGCGSTLKEYDHLLGTEAAKRFTAQVKDINEFLASIEMRAPTRPLTLRVTYQDSCHLAHGQKIRTAPRKVLNAIPGLTLVEMAGSDICCGSAGIYNVVQNEMAMGLLEKKMDSVAATGADAIATANPGCMIQLAAGARMRNTGQPVYHVIELLDQAYGAEEAS